MEAAALLLIRPGCCMPSKLPLPPNRYFRDSLKSLRCRKNIQQECSVIVKKKYLKEGMAVSDELYYTF